MGFINQFITRGTTLYTILPIVVVTHWSDRWMILDDYPNHDRDHNTFEQSPMTMTGIINDYHIYITIYYNTNVVNPIEPQHCGRRTFASLSHLSPSFPLLQPGHVELRRKPLELWGNHHRLLGSANSEVIWWASDQNWTPRLEPELFNGMFPC